MWMLCVGDFEIDIDSYLVCVCMVGIEVLIMLMLMEFWLFVYMVRLLSCVFMCGELFDVCMVDVSVLECMVDSYICRLCKKFEWVGVLGMFEVMCGVGY